MAAPKSESFDPSKYLRDMPHKSKQQDGSWGVSHQDYLDVKWRVLWLRTEHPDAKVTTRVEACDSSFALIHAHVELADGSVGEGTGFCLAEKWDRYPEKAETAAVGRALAHLGFGTQFVEADDDDLADSPVERRQPPKPMPQQTAIPQKTEAPVPGSDTASAAQVRFIFSLGKDHAIDEIDLVADCVQRYGIAPEGLTRRQASNFIDVLQGKVPAAV